eukprot:NODE_308_length_1816_cov_290.985286_g249_i0.p1 GENE.NODE_308_length_1816_cov_290.985286_g249_i0~~NODE_308_length_1816_cov_290.985286_g249_i0.p1  ORF type:complete len:501 (+),score=135.15 NODE_308_length_1816_cov_290.985286_g249_i0:79-1581(+)
MVVLAAAILTKPGKTLLSRQFVEMSRIRIEGLLSAFPKLMGTGKQYTYFETDTVRYIYQPIELLYLVLITNRSSNIVEDLETLRVLGRIISEYCQQLEEESISKNAFNLLFAFDEVIQLGYRENVTVEQVKTFLEMDSHEEKLAKAVVETKVAGATSEANLKAKQFSKEKRKNLSSSITSKDFSLEALTAEPATPTMVTPEDVPVKPSRPAGGKSGMALSGRKEDLLSKMVKSGELAAPTSSPGGASPLMASRAPAATSSVVMDSVHLKLDEKISAVLNRDGGFQSVEVKGDMFLTVSNSSASAIRVCLNKGNNPDYAWKTHPNINKQTFTTDRVLALKDPSKPFPVGSTLGILRWRLQNTNNFVAPILVNCWPGDSSVSIEYEMDRDDLELYDVVIAIPTGGATPDVESVDYGEHRFDASEQMMYWCLDKVNADNNQGSMEFTLDSAVDPAAFFPVAINFTAKSVLANVQVMDVLSNETGLSQSYSHEVICTPERYEVV